MAPTNHRKATRAIPENTIASLARPQSAAGGRAEQSVEEHTPCFHCLDTGWFMLTAENDFGELEDYFVLWRKCKEA